MYFEWGMVIVPPSDVSLPKIGTSCVIYEPPRGKTNNVVSEKVRHKSGCTVTEAG